MSNENLHKSYLTHLKNTTCLLENGSIGYKEWGDAILGDKNVYSRDNLRKAFYVINKILPKIGAINDITNEDIIDEIKQQKNELYKERCRLQDQRRECNKELRAEARFDHLCDIVRDELGNFKLKESEEIHTKYNPKSDKSAILCLSDWHYGALVDSQWNYYSTEVAEQRAVKLFEQVQSYCLELGIKDLAIEINGDMVEGLINISNKCQSEETVAEQIPHVSALLARCINSLKPYVKNIIVVTTLGNHGRLVANKKEQTGEKENFELMIPVILKTLLDNDIKLITSQGLDIVKYEFMGKTIGLAHGHNDGLEKAINNFIKLYKVVPDEIHLGHYHSSIDKNVSNIYVNVNGSLKGSDDYAVSKVRATTKPSQNLIVYGNNRMVIEIIVE